MIDDEQTLLYSILRRMPAVGDSPWPPDGAKIMLTVTEPAGAHLEKLLDEAEAPEGAAARFVASEEGLTLQLDNPKPEDETHDHGGRTVLLLDQQVAELLSDKTLDLQQTEQGPSLALHMEEGGEGEEEAE